MRALKSHEQDLKRFPHRPAKKKKKPKLGAIVSLQVLYMSCFKLLHNTIYEIVGLIIRIDKKAIKK
jgi:hypothetical protein